MVKAVTTPTTKRVVKKDYVAAVGRRREAVARVRLYSSPSVTLKSEEYRRGDVIVNQKPVGTYFAFKAYQPLIAKFFERTGSKEKFIYTIKVAGGGLHGQLEAVLHGIARALDKVDSEKYHTIVKENGYLTRDARTRERRKVGTGGKARRQKQSPKR